MGNPVKGEVELNLDDGRRFTLVADHSALVKAAQAHSGKTKLQRLIRDMQPEVDKDGKILVDEDGDPVKDTLPAMAAFLYGTLDAHHPGVTQREATNILLSEPEKVTVAITEAAELAFPDAKQGEPGNGGKPPRGKSSGRSGAKSG